MAIAIDVIDFRFDRIVNEEGWPQQRLMATMVGSYFHRLGHFKGLSALYSFSFLESIVSRIISEVCTRPLRRDI